MKRVVAFALIGPLVLCVINNSQALAYSPESARVRKIAADAIEFLEGRESGNHSTLGGVCLKGLACYKYYHCYQDLGVSAVDRPQVKFAVETVRSRLKSGLDRKDDSFNYSVGIAIIFLCEIDGNQQANRSEIEQLLKMLYSAQRPDGAWSYLNHKTGDTSQTQYGVLATWYAMKKGYQVPVHSLARGVDWIVRTQDPSGEFPYQGYDPGPGNYNRVRQGAVRLTMSPAALGCLYLAKDMAGLSGPAVERENTGVFISIDAVAKPKRVTVNGPMLQRAIDDGNRWYNANHSLADLDTGKNFHYYLYSFERYHAMKSVSEGTTGRPAPWYDAGVEILAETQTDGMWSGTRGPIISTSFAMLFLLRSMERTIEDTASGQLQGGQKLPPDLTRLTEKDLQKDGQVVGPKKPITDIASIADHVRNIDIRYLEYSLPDLDHFDFDDNRVERKKQVDSLRVDLSSPVFLERLIASKLIAGSGDIENVPHLIFAITDEDPRVTSTARNGLRLISRKFNGFGLSDLPSAAEKELAAKNWRRWYRSVRVGANFDRHVN
jgi:hypothetical protein